jgi:small ligand-binding sensory domain FIST
MEGLHSISLIQGGARSAAAASGHPDPRTAATEIAHALHDTMGDTSTLLLLFASFHHAAAFPDAGEIVRSTLGPQTMLGVTAESVFGGRLSLEGIAGMSALAITIPNVTSTTWTTTLEDPIRISRPEAIPEQISLRDDTRGVFLLADPFSTPSSRLVPALGGVLGPKIPLLGGIASGASQPRCNTLLADDRVLHRGGVGCTLSGEMQLEPMVSQGCRPIGEPLVVTAAKGNVLESLGGQRAIEVLKEITDQLDPSDRSLLKDGLMLGTVIDEYKQRFGRGDFLIRNVMGTNRKRGTIAVADILRVGQTVQFHLKDSETASEDLDMVMEPHQLDESPLAAILLSCSGRTKKLFGEEGHDLGRLLARFGAVPCAGCHAAGEIGPIGGRPFLHGHTAAIGLIRSRRAPEDH